MTTGFTHESTVNESVEWYTPSFIFEKLGLVFDVDVASPMSGPLPWIPARRFITSEQNALVTPWGGRFWCNPPYGDMTGKFLKIASQEGDGIALVFARTDTKWFHSYCSTATAICFVEKRIRFCDREGIQGGSPGAGSMLVAWGEVCTKALEASGLGLTVRLRSAPPPWLVPGT